MRRFAKCSAPALAALLVAAAPAPAQDAAPLPGVAPFGDQISEERLPYYHRATPLIATSGPIDDLGIIEAKRVGFAAIVDLRPSSTALANRLRRAEFSRIQYVHLPVGGPVPTDEEVRRFAGIVSARGNLPLLLHGASIDQSGAMWALYRASLGVPPAIALLDGETAGLGPSRELVRARLGTVGGVVR